MELIALEKGELSQMIRNAMKEAIAEIYTKAPETKSRLSINEALLYLKELGFPLSKSMLYKFTMGRSLPFEKFGNRILFNRDELKTWAESRARDNQKINPVTVQVAKCAKRKLEKSFAV